MPVKSTDKISRIEMILNQINEINNFQHKKYRSNYFQLFITEKAWMNRRNRKLRNPPREEKTKEAEPGLLTCPWKLGSEIANAPSPGERVLLFRSEFASPSNQGSCSATHSEERSRSTKAIWEHISSK